MVSRCSSRRETQLPILPLSDSDSSFRNKLSNFYWKVRAEHLGWSTLARSLSRALFAPLSYESRIDGSAKGKRILPVGAALSPRGNLPSRFFSPAPFALSRRASIFPTLSSARGPRCKALALHSAICYHPLSIYRRAIDSCVISRPIINKSVAFIVAHSRRALHLQHFHDRTRERAVSEQERLGLGEKRDAFHCVQNREEHRPAIRNSSGTVSSSISSAQEANDFSRWKPGRAG
ncbi:hypothetical protein ACS0PU_010103 [Formica fusca]